MHLQDYHSSSFRLKEFVHQPLTILVPTCIVLSCFLSNIQKGFFNKVFTISHILYTLIHTQTAGIYIDTYLPKTQLFHGTVDPWWYKESLNFLTC